MCFNAYILAGGDGQRLSVPQISFTLAGSAADVRSKPVVIGRQPPLPDLVEGSTIDAAHEYLNLPHPGDLGPHRTLWRNSSR